MTRLKALTVRQPHASLISVGVKLIETRSWATKHRGPIAIHAGAAKPQHLSRVGEWWCHPLFCDEGPELRRLGSVRDGVLNPDRFTDGTAIPMPFGAVVATANLVDCVPIVEWGADPQADHLTACRGGGLNLWHFIPGSMPLGWSAYDPATRESAGGPGIDDRSDQLPYGDFAPGRFAWLLDDVKPTTERCPACWGKGWVDCPMPDRAGHGPDCRAACGACETTGKCPPIPAKGKQGLWTWLPPVDGER